MIIKSASNCTHFPGAGENPLTLYTSFHMGIYMYLKLLFLMFKNKFLINIFYCVTKWIFILEISKISLKKQKSVPGLGNV